MVSQGEMEYKDLLDHLVKMEALDDRVLLDHSAAEGPSTPGGGRALVHKWKEQS